MYARMSPKEVDKIEKYISGLADMILGSVKASKLKTMQEAIEFTTELMDEKTHAYAERQVLVHLGAITAKRLAIWPRIIEADLQMLITTTATTTM
ncbi:hypothetical protein Tco_0288970 [Tanacetum coccineum]